MNIDVKIQNKLLVDQRKTIKIIGSSQKMQGVGSTWENTRSLLTTLNKVGWQGTFVHRIKAMDEKTTANIIFSAEVPAEVKEKKRKKRNKRYPN